MADKAQHISVIKNEAKRTAQVTLSGIIDTKNSDKSFNAQKFIHILESLEAEYDTILIKIVNFYGGSVQEGLPVYEHIQNSETEIKVEVHGLAASMGAIIALAAPAANTSISRLSRIMLHRAAAQVSGNADQLIESAENIRVEEAKLVAIVAERTGLTEDEVMQKWFDGKNHFISADQAVKLKLVGSTATKRVKTAPPAEVLKNSDPAAIYAFYDRQLNETPETTEIMNQKELAEALGLKASAGEAEIMAGAAKAVQDASDALAKVDELQAKLDEQAEASAEALIERAKAANKSMTADEQADLKELALVNLGLAEKTVGLMVTHTSAAERLNNQAGGAGVDPIAGKTYGQLEKENPKALEQLKAEQPAVFESLRNAHLETLRDK